jgi:hypothetical protein
MRPHLTLTLSPPIRMGAEREQPRAAHKPPKFNCWRPIKTVGKKLRNVLKFG